jgi:putative ABC transport system permease protein
MWKFALRNLRVSLPTIISLSLGFAATAVLLAVFYTVLIDPLPLKDSKNLVQLNEINPKTQNRIAVTQRNARDLEQAQTGLAALATYACFNATAENLSSDSRFRADSCTVSSEFFRTLDVVAKLGRTFATAAELEQQPQVALISEDLWRTRFQSAPDVIGKQLDVDGSRKNIIGVIAQAAVFPAGAQIWISDQASPVNNSRSAHNFQAIARLSPGVSLAQASLRLDQLAMAWKKQYGVEMTTDRFPITPLVEALVGNYQQLLWTTLAGAIFLLLIAVMNVSNLWMTRALEQQAAMKTQAALGASALRLAREFALQLALPFAISFVTALILAQLTLQTNQHWLAQHVPRAETVAISATHVAILLAVAVVMFGFCVTLPVLQILRKTGSGDLKATARGESDSRAMQVTREVLCALQTSFSIVLLIGMALLVQTMMKLQSVSMGFRMDQIVTANIALDMKDLAHAQTQQLKLQSVLTELQARPGVTHAALSSAMPLSSGGGNGTFLIETINTPVLASGDFSALEKRYASAPDSRKGQAEFRVVSENFFRTLDISTRLGRTFQASDSADRAHVAVISQALADRYFPNNTAIGQLLQFGGMDGDLRPLQIIGVAADIKGQGADQAAEETVYVHLAQRPLAAGNGHFLLRGSISEGALSKVLTDTLNNRANLPTQVKSMRSIYEFVHRLCNRGIRLGAAGAVCHDAL